MTSVLLPDGITRIAIVDDNDDELVLKSAQFRRLGFEPHPIRGTFRTVRDLVDRITSQAHGVVCDNYLQPGGYASFYGAEAVARLYERKFPAVLISQFLDQDYDVSIRRWRRQIPAILAKDEAHPERILQGLQACLREHRGEFLPSRRACRTLVQVVRLESEAKKQVVDAIVLSWNPQHPVRFPASLIPHKLRSELEVGRYFIAKVNTGAESAADIFFYDFELAPDPIAEDQLV
jgi:hypothetical protein